MSPRRAPDRDRQPRAARTDGAAVSPEIRALLETAARIVASRMTQAGHLAQVVTQEHRGNCRHDRCSPACLEAGAWLVEVDELLLATEPRQLRLDAAPQAERPGRVERRVS